MSKTYIQEVLSTRSSDEEILQTKSLPNGMWHVQTSDTHYLVRSGSSIYLSDHLQLDETVSWIDSERAAAIVHSCDQFLVSWPDFIAFIEDGAMTPEIDEATLQQLSDRWKSFKDLRALHLFNYTQAGVIVEAIDANCVTPWDYLDTSLPMPEPDINCVAFLGHGELGWPREFLKKLFEFSKPR